MNVRKSESLKQNMMFFAFFEICVISLYCSPKHGALTDESLRGCAHTRTHTHTHSLVSITAVLCFWTSVFIRPDIRIYGGLRGGLSLQEDQLLSNLTPDQELLSHWGRETGLLEELGQQEHRIITGPTEERSS